MLFTASDGLTFLSCGIIFSKFQAGDSPICDSAWIIFYHAIRPVRLGEGLFREFCDYFPFALVRDILPSFFHMCNPGTRPRRATPASDPGTRPATGDRQPTTGDTATPRHATRHCDDIAQRNRRTAQRNRSTATTTGSSL